jgi:hypothetical protein
MGLHEAQQRPHQISHAARSMTAAEFAGSLG